MQLVVLLYSIHGNETAMSMVLDITRITYTGTADYTLGKRTKHSRTRKRAGRAYICAWYILAKMLLTPMPCVCVRRVEPGVLCLMQHLVLIGRFSK